MGSGTSAFDVALNAPLGDEAGTPFPDPGLISAQVTAGAPGVIPNTFAVDAPVACVAACPLRNSSDWPREARTMKPLTVPSTDRKSSLLFLVVAVLLVLQVAPLARSGRSGMPMRTSIRTTWPSSLPARNTPASGPADARDLDGDGQITCARCSDRRDALHASAVQHDHDCARRSPESPRRLIRRCWRRAPPSA